jgi:cell wall-associated NlpC family hydrolase
MFNPETIQRDYVAYMEQQALDPFNTIYGSNNLVAPPGILDFQFTLLFDRQTENANGSMPRGVLEDYDYFDLVVRGVIPDGQSPQLQDNGIMMINPRNITVVFSPQLSVQGRPYRASVNYTKFDHRMTPIRMEITVSMKAYYFGPIKEDFSFASSTDSGTYEATIPYDENITYEATYIDVQQALTTDDAATLSQGATNARSTLTNINNAVGGINDDVRLAALAKAKSLGEFKVPYTWGRRNDPPEGGFDCSGLVYWAYDKTGAIEAIGGRSAGYTRPMRDRAVEMNTIIAGGRTSVPFDRHFVENYLKPGDLLLSQDNYSDHIAFVSGIDINNKKVFSYESRGGGPHSDSYDYTATGQYSIFDWYNYVLRPAAAGSYTVAGNIGNLGLNFGPG